MILDDTNINRVQSCIKFTCKAITGIWMLLSTITYLKWHKSEKHCSLPNIWHDSLVGTLPSSILHLPIKLLTFFVLNCGSKFHRRGISDCGTCCYCVLSMRKESPVNFVCIGDHPHGHQATWHHYNITTQCVETRTLEAKRSSWTTSVVMAKSLSACSITGTWV